MTPLQTSAQSVLDRFESVRYANLITPQVIESQMLDLSKALADEQAQTSLPATHKTTGWAAPVDRYAVPVLFNPYTGDPRDVRDVQSDPQGVLIVPPGKVEMLAAKPTVESVTDCMMNLVDRLGHEASDVDARAWEHLLVYAPKQAQAVEPVCSQCKGLGYYDEGHENDDGSMSGGNYVDCACNKKDFTQCTTVTNDCLGGCKSLSEHQNYTHPAPPATA